MLMLYYEVCNFWQAITEISIQLENVNDYLYNKIFINKN